MEKGIVLFNTFLLTFIFLSTTVMAQNLKTIERGNVKVHIFTSDPVIFEVASVVFEGKDEVVLIDAQFSKNNAQSLVDLIKKTGKPLTTIFISYSDPDFYFGLDHIVKNFPEAKIYSTAQTAYLIDVTKEEKLSIWGPQLGVNAPEQIIVPSAIGQSYFMLGNTKVEIIQPQNDEQHSYLWIPSLKTVLGGIYINEGSHLWVADSQTADSRQKWVAALNEMEALNPEYVFPAHFSVTTGTVKGASAIKSTRQYLLDLEEILKNSENSQQLIDIMKALYPDLGGVSSLEMTAKVLTGEMPWTSIDAYPLIGKKAQADFGGDFVFELNFIDNKHMTFTGIKGTQKGVTDNVIYTAIEVAPKVYMVYWTEPSTNTHVVHVQDFNKGSAYTNISSPNGAFTNLKGTIDLEASLELKPQVKHIFPLCCLPDWEMGRDFVHICKHGILQYTVIRPLTTAIAL